MPEIEVNIEVYCAYCGAGLCNQTESTRTLTRGALCFRVKPCERCLAWAEGIGYDRGYVQGQEEHAAEAAGGDE